MAELTQLEPAKPSNFDAHKAPETALIEDCVHCGFCLPACPTYVLWGEEMDSPRGRIYMMKKSAQGEAPLDQRFQLHMDNCLGCMACMTACPSGVQYNKLIEDTRAQVERNIPRSTADSLFRSLLFATFPYVRRLRLLALPMMVYQRSGLQRLLRATGLLRLLPKRLRQMESLLPRVPNGFMLGLPARVAPAAPPRRRVGMLAGCVQQVFFQHVNQATARVLAAEGCEVIIPPAQQCCGALMLHSGLDEQASALARTMIATFEAANVDTIVINAAGCGSSMKEYGHLLRDDPAWPSARSVKTLRRFYVNGRRGLCDTRCRCAWPTTTRATCGMRRQFTLSRGCCWPRFPAWRSPRWKKHRSAAARPAFTTCCTPSPPTN
jgi:glycolate oxidase iron-sulfur subunit